MKNLFIDSNIWLSLYYYTNDDLTQFAKLKELNGETIQIYIPQQVYDEVCRNREAKLKEALKQFQVQDIHFPAFCKAYKEYEKIEKAYKNIRKEFSKWEEVINKDILDKSLSADKTIEDFFIKSQLLECDSVVDKAYIRYKKGNPPGKDNKYGDAINWECLLKYAPDNEDLYLISADKDYSSEIDINKINPFLEDEWKTNKNSNIFFYKDLVSFLSEHIKEIKLKTEREKQDIIENLKRSGGFSETHGIIAMLNQYNGWTEVQIESICEAAVENTQVKWIFEDQDIYDFYHKILSKVDKTQLLEGYTKTVLGWVLENGTTEAKSKDVDIPSL